MGFRLSAVLTVAACLSIPAASHAALVSSVQSGTAVSSSNGTLTVPISSIDPARSFLVFQVRHDSNRPVAALLRGRIASATSLEFVRVTDEVTPVATTIQWYVASFASGVTVQRGEVAQATQTIDVPIAAVAAVNQAFVTWSKTPIASDGTWDTNDPLVAELTSTTNLQFRVNFETAAHIIWWQVIEFTNPADITVQKGSIATMTGATTSVTATLGSAVDVGRTFVLVGFRSSGAGADVGSRMLRARLTDSTTITIDRAVSGTPDDITEIVWQAVELKDGSSVEGGSESFSGGTAQRVVSLARSFDPGRSLALASVQAAGGQNMGRTPYVADDVLGVASFTMALGATQLTIDRGSTAAAADVGWFAVQFKSRRVMITED
jgi:hypothetical protein